MLAAMYFFLRGTPFIYQGQELGTTNVWKDSVCEFDDIESRGQYLSALSDGCTKEEALYYINPVSYTHLTLPTKRTGTILTCAAETMQER